MLCYSHLFQNFPQFIVIHTVKGFGIVNKAEIDVFLEFSCFFHDPADVGNLISGSSAFSKTSLNIREFTVHVLLKSSLENFPPLCLPIIHIQSPKAQVPLDCVPFPGQGMTFLCRCSCPCSSLHFAAQLSHLRAAPFPPWPQCSQCSHPQHTC